MAAELVKAGQVEDARLVLKVAVQQDPQLCAVVLDLSGAGGNLAANLLAAR